MSDSRPRALRTKAVLADLAVLVEPGNRWRWVVLVVLAVVGAGIEAVGALLIFYVTSWLVGADSADILGGILPQPGAEGIPAGVIALIAIFFLVRGGFLLLLTWFQSRAVYLTAAGISDRLFRRYLTAPYQVYLTRNSTELMRNALSSVEGVATRFLTPLVSVVTEAIVVVVLMVVLAITAPLATLLVAAVLGIASIVVMRLVRTRLRRYGKQAERATQTSLATIQQSFNESRSIRILGRERYFADAFSVDRLEFAESRLSLAVFSKIPRVAIETLVFLLLVGFLSFISTADPVGSIGVFGLFGYAALRIMPGLNAVVSGLNLIRYGQASLDNVMGDLADASQNPPELDVSAAPRERLQWSELVFEDVAFTYAETAPPALVNADLTIRRNEILGLVGHTGSGKSTLIDLMLGLLEPSHGHIQIDGQQLSDVKRAWQSNLGLVPQDIFLLDDSILKNVAFGIAENEIDRERAEECLRIAQLAEFVANSSQGVETRIGERGTSISGGERQRIAIARALYASPTLLILDEGTSAIDTVTELNLVNELKSSAVIDTVIVVSHRLSSLRICDSIAIMDHGRIVETGRYETLMETSAILSDLSRASHAGLIEDGEAPEAGSRRLPSDR
ncbi:MAG TPA: ABC transporter ATP-binding protein [Acidimicrobiia bacterium]